MVAFSPLALLALFCAPSLASPAITSRKTEIVYNPEILYPIANVTWRTDKSYKLRWDTSGMPQEAYNYTGKALLGYGGQGDDSEHLDFAHPLAEGFLIRSGHVWLNIPDVEPRNDYIIALLGDSGNISPQFTITDACDA